MNPYISKVESIIAFYKRNGKNRFIDFTIPFTNSEKLEFESWCGKNNYSLDIRRCPKGKYDIIITFPLDK